MGSKHQRWHQWETDVQDALDLRSMPGSGNQWFAPSDGRTVGHWTETRWPLMVDCKHTAQKSYSLARKALDQWVRTAQTSGCRFALPIRFETVDDTSTTRSDYVVIPMTDYVELVASVRQDTAPPATEPLTDDERRLIHTIADKISAPQVQRRFLAVMAKVGV